MSKCDPKPLPGLGIVRVEGNDLAVERDGLIPKLVVVSLERLSQEGALLFVRGAEEGKKFRVEPSPLVLRTVFGPGLALKKDSRDLPNPLGWEPDSLGWEDEEKREKEGEKRCPGEDHRCSPVRKDPLCPFAVSIEGSNGTTRKTFRQELSVAAGVGRPLTPDLHLNGDPARYAATVHRLLDGARRVFRRHQLSQNLVNGVCVCPSAFVEDLPVLIHHINKVRKVSKNLVQLFIKAIHQAGDDEAVLFHQEPCVLHLVVITLVFSVLAKAPLFRMGLPDIHEEDLHIPVLIFFCQLLHERQLPPGRRSGEGPGDEDEVLFP